MSPLSRWPTVFALGISLIVATSAGGQEVSWSRYEIALPGQVSSTEVTRDGADGLVMLLTADGGEGARRIAHLDLTTGSPRLRLVTAALAGELEDLALVDLDGDGREEVLVAGGGETISLGTVHLELLTGPRGPVGDLPGEGLEGARSLADGGLVVTRAGSVERFRPDAEGRLRADERLPMPVEARRRSWGLELESPPTVQLGDGSWVAGPLGDGPRISTHVVRAGEKPIAAWSQLPGRELMQSAHYAEVEGELLLVVTSIEKRGVFVKNRLRIFRPEAARSRVGGAPIFATDTDSHFWYDVDSHFVDLDRDGVRDLVVIYPEGMGGGDLELDTYRGLGRGRFDAHGYTTKLAVSDPQRRYGDDVDGDGTPDLVTLSGGRLAIWRGLAGPAAWKVVGKNPTWTISVRVDPEYRQEVEATVQVGTEEIDVERLHGRRLEVVDLDGDGQVEVLVWGREENGNGHLTLIRRQ